jgi:8-oxo-dGTP pyrophosphatase MutT (NUDIX family)
MSDINKLVLESLGYRERVEVVIFKDKQVLLSVISPYPPKVTRSYYGFPGGGIDVGDSAVKTCQKECLEECAIKIKNIKKINIPSFTFEWENRKILDNKTSYSKKLEKRVSQYKGTLTDYYSADFNKEDFSKHGIDGQKTEYIFVPISKAILLIKDQIRTHTDPKNIPIFKYRLKVLMKLK